jgi:hypothetical protein
MKKKCLPKICCIYFTVVGAVVYEIYNVVTISILLTNVALAVTIYNKKFSISYKITFDFSLP